MKAYIPRVLQFVGLLLLAYGIYQVIIPEASIDLGIVSASAQDNTDAYTTIVIGLVSIGLGFFMGKKNIFFTCIREISSTTFGLFKSFKKILLISIIKIRARTYNKSIF